VGRYNARDSSHEVSLIAHWDGTAWTRVASPVLSTAQYLYGVAATAPDAVWAVGAQETSSATQALILRWDGTTWTPVPGLTPDFTNRLYSVVAHGDTAWASGSFGPSLYAGGSTLIGRYTPTCPSPTPTAPLPTVPPTAVPPTPSATAIPPTSTPAPLPACPFAIQSVAACIDPQGCVSYTVPLRNEGNTAVTVTGSVVFQRRDGTVLGEQAIPPTTIEAESTVPLTGQVCGHVDPAVGPFQLVVRVQDIARVCATRTKRQPLMICDQPFQPPTFSDVPPGHPFAAFIRWTTGYAYLQGYPCGGAGEPCSPTRDPYLRPGDRVTRGQLVKMVVNASRWPPPLPATPTFSDVPSGHPFYPYVETAVRQGVVGGYACGTRADEACDAAQRPYFRPGALLTRGQLSQVITRAWGLGFSAGAPPTFADVPPTHPFYAAIEALAAAGLSGGYACGPPYGGCDAGAHPYFQPAAPATRGQVTKLIALAYGGP
jgi:hypothetical protein